MTEFAIDMAPEITLHLTGTGWDGFHLRSGAPVLRVDGAERTARLPEVTGTAAQRTLQLDYGDGLHLTLDVRHAEGSVRITGRLRNESPHDIVLNDVALLHAGGSGGSLSFGAGAASVRVLEQGNYWGHVRPLGEPAVPTAAADGEGDVSQATTVSGASDHVWVAWDRVARRGLLAGFLTSERWQGRVEVEAAPDGSVRRWRLGFDGADVRLPAGQTADLEEVFLSLGDDPWQLLEDYGDRVAARHGTVVSGPSPVSWCSWYPYRLSVSEERIVDTARIAARRLASLGLSTLVVDLGWQAGNLPSTFDENERFPSGLRWLADRLQEVGLRLGAWTAAYSISEYDPVVREHPEYLIPGEDGAPAVTGTWFWEPHGKVHILDLTHPGARAWLAERMRSLAERGVSYLKPDFIGTVTHPLARRRHDDTIASGGGTQAGRLGAQTIRQALPEATILNCGGPEMPGTGAHDLLYTCNDTGNSGFIGTDFQRRNTQSLACHLWKHRRWGILQPSCLVVGGPGTLEEARLRATIAFLAGGQVDISDTLTSLPEDRWAVLTATLPTLGVAATPVDLFEPLPAIPFGYERSTRGDDPSHEALPDLPAGSVWHLHVDGGWDTWDLVGLLAFPDDAGAESPQVTRFVVPLERLGLGDGGDLCAFEVWSGQFAGTLPGGRRNRDGYAHPGDYQDLLAGTDPSVLDLAFFGPAARLLCLRRSRPHPWVAGTTFHQSGGTELTEVAWENEAHRLTGVLRRPAGETGLLVLSTAGCEALSAEVDGRPATARTGAGGSVVLPVVTAGDETRWSVTFD